MGSDLLTVREIRFFLKIFSYLIITQMIVYAFLDWKDGGFFDYLSYVFPILAGLSAGAGLVTRFSVGGPDGEPSTARKKEMGRVEGWLYLLSYFLMNKLKICLLVILRKIDGVFNKREWWNEAKDTFRLGDKSDVWFYSLSAFFLFIGMFFYNFCHTCKSVNVVLNCIFSGLAALFILEKRLIAKRERGEGRVLGRVVHVLTAIFGLLMGALIVYGSTFFVLKKCVD